MNVMQEFGKSWKHKSKVLLMCNDAKNCLVEHLKPTHHSINMTLGWKLGVKERLSEHSQ